MMKLAILGRSFPDQFTPHIEHLFKVLKASDIEYWVYEEFAHFLKEKLQLNGAPTFKETSDIKDKVDYLLSVGGDGTLLQSATVVANTGIPILGINTGRLGFLSSVKDTDIELAIKELSEGKYTLDKRTLLSLETEEGLFGATNFALNELTVHKKDSSSMITVHTYINGEYLNTYWADGLIVATPTGSTGYSLSCGGPIISPGSENFIITPIAPHNLNIRPFVVSDDCILKLKVEGRGENFLATLDSRSVTIDENTELIVRKSPFQINLIRLSNESFLTTLRNKMMWGVDKRNY